jgi:hypothetical protein
MGLHDVLVADENHAKMNAVIDWELCASAPFLAAYDCIDELFRMGAPKGHGPGYPRADERTSFVLPFGLRFQIGRLISKVMLQRTSWNGFTSLKR